MGLKLKTQIAGILFLLFALTVVITGFFNLSILYEAMKSLSEDQSRTLATNVIAWAEKRQPPEGYSEQFFREHAAYNRELTDYLNQVRGMRTFQILDGKGEAMWTFGLHDQGLPIQDEAVRHALATGHPFDRLWEYSSSADLIGRPLDSHGPVLLSPYLAFHYYRPLFGANGAPLAVLRVSLNLEEMPRRLFLTLMGNVGLSIIFLVTAFIAISIWTANAINRPLEFILKAQEQIGRGDFTAHVSVEMPSTNEMVSISSSFNRMAADLRRFKKELEIKTLRLEELNCEYKRLNEHLESEVENKTLELRDFFSVITHDMKVPLAAIQGYADLLMRSRNNPLNEKQLRFVQGVSTACSHLLNMTRNMLESVKYDGGKVCYYTEDFDLSDIALGVVSQIKEQAAEKGIRIWYEVPPLCRQVQGDRTKLTQVFTNLVMNAVKFTPDGGAIEIRARDRGAVVEVEVTDTGVGIGTDQIPHLFEKFTQFHTQEGATSSIGLGLYIVRKILEGHGQSIRVQSTPNQGSTFTFTLAKGSKAVKAESLDTLDSELGLSEASVAAAPVLSESVELQKPSPSPGALI